ncbi:MAG TPA: hypothetical protein VFQ41_05755 [Candidatus Angelobacter sp.]|nr:hypothetical protein [Candidatus Angelobacter sp.]
MALLATASDGGSTAAGQVLVNFGQGEWPFSATTIVNPSHRYAGR